MKSRNTRKIATDDLHKKELNREFLKKELKRLEKQLEGLKNE